MLVFFAKVDSPHPLATMNCDGCGLKLFYLARTSSLVSAEKAIMEKVARGSRKRKAEGTGRKYRAGFCDCAPSTAFCG